MADQANADPDVEQTLIDTDARNDRAAVEAFDTLTDADVEWELTVESDALSAEARDALQTIVYNTIGRYRFIVGKDRYIDSGVYWTLVSEYADEVMETLDEDPEWADDDVMVFHEIVMPTEMARFYEADPVANFSVLSHSKHHGEGWLQEIHDKYFGRGSIDGFIEYIEDSEGWAEVLSSMAVTACIQDVAQKVRAEGYELDLDHYEYRNDL